MDQNKLHQRSFFCAIAKVDLKYFVHDRRIRLNNESDGKKQQFTRHFTTKICLQFLSLFFANVDLVIYF